MNKWSGIAVLGVVTAAVIAFLSIIHTPETTGPHIVAAAVVVGVNVILALIILFLK